MSQRSNWINDNYFIYEWNFNLIPKHTVIQKFKVKFYQRVSDSVEMQCLIISRLAEIAINSLSEQTQEYICYLTSDSANPPTLPSS